MDKASAYGAEDSRFDPWCGSSAFCFNRSNLSVHSESFLPEISCHVKVVCLLVGQPKKSQNRKAFCQRFLAMSKSFACLCGKKSQSSSQRKMRASTPGIEPGIFRSVGGRLIHWAMRNEAQEDLMQNWMHKPKI